MAVRYNDRQVSVVDISDPGIDTMGDDTFDFKPLLTSEPTAPAGNDGGEPPRQMFQQIMQQMTQGGSPPDTFDFTTEPSAPEIAVDYNPYITVDYLL